MAKPEDFALKGELFLTQGVIRPDEEIYKNEATYKRHLEEIFPGFELRFDYANLFYDDRMVTSREFGHLCSSLPRGQAFGVSVYGKKK